MLSHHAGAGADLNFEMWVSTADKTPGVSTLADLGAEGSRARSAALGVPDRDLLHVPDVAVGITE